MSDPRNMRKNGTSPTIENETGAGTFYYPEIPLRIVSLPLRRTISRNILKVTSLNISHWSKRVMHATRVVKITINNDVILAVACLLRERWTADWLIGQCRTFHRIFS